MMKQFSLNSLRTIAYSHLFLSLCPAALIVSTYLIMDNSFYRVSIDLLLFVFCSSLFIYNLNVFSVSESLSSVTERQSWICLHKRELKLLLILSAAGTFYFSLYISFHSILLLFHLSILSVLYVIPLRIGQRVFALRQFPLVKIFVLTYVWTSVTVLLPCIESCMPFNQRVILLLLERFLFIFALALLFDIRDLELDKKANLITLPGILGIKYAIGIPKLLVAAFVLLSLLIEGFSYVTIGRIILAILTLILIEKAGKEHKDDLFYMLGVDGLMILQFIILILLWFFLN